MHDQIRRVHQILMDLETAHKHYSVESIMEMTGFSREVIELAIRSF